MTLIKSISGIRGTIGDIPGENLTPLDIVKFTTAYGLWIKKENSKSDISVIVGRDARPSGKMVNQLVAGTLVGLGINVIDLGLATTPTVEMAVIKEKANGGIILTASHNPVEWNALKLLNNKGEFLTAGEGTEVLSMIEDASYKYATVDKLGKVSLDNKYLSKHIAEIKELSFVDIKAIKEAGFKIAVDAVNSVGGIAVPELLKELGVNNIVKINCQPNGIFAHNPEPLPENLTEISSVMTKEKADVGFVVDPDVDRLAIINEDGTMFGEEYTLVAVADYILKQKKGNTVSNLSSTKSLKELSEKYGVTYTPSAVGEVNVVEKMKETKAVIGGEGNGGVILPDLHYGRDALVGIALFLTFLAKSKKRCSELRAQYPQYYISKNKIKLTPEINVDSILKEIPEIYNDYPINSVDGVKIEFEDGWVHLRKSNTEPIIRVYSEGNNKKIAENLADKVIRSVQDMIKK
jgi:phosphomannomutase